MGDTKPKFWFLYPLSWFALFGLLLGCGGFGQNGGGPTGGQAGNGSASPGEKVTVRKLDQKASDELSSAFFGNKQAARDKYKNVRWEIDIRTISVGNGLTAKADGDFVGWFSLTFRDRDEVLKVDRGRRFVAVATAEEFDTGNSGLKMFIDATVKPLKK